MPLPSTTAAKKIFLSPKADLVLPVLLAVFAIAYYALYVTSGLNLGGEGGTAGVVAMRLMDGQLPIVDTFLGYNVMWFLPVAGLFELTGPSYLALRWYFFAFCTASGLMTFFLVRGYTRNSWFSAVPAFLVILVPGMLFRNYMPFLGVLNALLLTRAFAMRRDSETKTLLWMLGAGAGLGLTFLFRIDLGIFNTLIFCGLGLLYPLGVRGEFGRRARLALAGVLGGLLLAWAVHLPVWSDAKARGYDRAFLEQYTGWLAMIRTEFQQQMADLAENDGPVAALPAAPPAAPAPLPTPAPGLSAQPTPEPNADSWEDRGALARPALSEIFHGEKWTNRSFAMSAYLPLLVSAMAILVGGIAFLIALIRRDVEARERLLYPLTVLGCSLTLFPQFFFFRPDTPHLSEMMVPFLSALALLLWAAGRRARLAKSAAIRVASAAFAALCALTAGIYISHALPKESAGSIAARKKATQPFEALNGVQVKVRSREAIWLPPLRDAILQHSSPGDFLLCLPYSPTINFMTDRPSPLYNLYVDNAAGSGDFLADFPRLMADSRPAVVVIDERAINKNEISRFRNWAPGPYVWLFENYVYFGRYFRSEVFIRPDKVAPDVIPASIEASE